MQTNVWLTLKWNDCQFGWNPRDYGGIESMRVPQVNFFYIIYTWNLEKFRIEFGFLILFCLISNFLLFNAKIYKHFLSADGNYEVSYHSNVVVDHQGNVIWVPPAIYKSSCRIGK